MPTCGFSPLDSSIQKFLNAVGPNTRKKLSGEKKLETLLKNYNYVGFKTWYNCEKHRKHASIVWWQLFCKDCEKYILYGLSGYLQRMKNTANYISYQQLPVKRAYRVSDLIWYSFNLIYETAWGNIQLLSWKTDLGIIGAV